LLPAIPSPSARHSRCWSSRHGPRFAFLFALALVPPVALVALALAVLVVLVLAALVASDCVLALFLVFAICVLSIFRLVFFVALALVFLAVLVAVFLSFILSPTPSLLPFTVALSLWHTQGGVDVGSGVGQRVSGAARGASAPRSARARRTELEARGGAA